MSWLSLKKYLIRSGVVLAIIITALFLYKRFTRLKDENKRLTANITTMQSDIKFYESTDEKNIAEIGMLYQTIAEINTQKSELAKEIKTMKIKLSNVKNATIINKISNYDTIPLVKNDTILLIDTVKIHITDFKYQDEWLNINMFCEHKKDTCIANIETRDSLLIVQTVREKKFLWWKCKKYTGKIAVKNYNPYSKVTYLQSIETIK